MRMMRTLLVAGTAGFLGLASTQAHAQEPQPATATQEQSTQEQSTQDQVSQGPGGPADEEFGIDGLNPGVNYLTECNAHVYTDHVDRQPSEIYGAATVECDPGYLPRWPMTVDLFRMTPGGNPEWVATSGQIDCTYTPCSGATSQFTIEPGHTQYCARVMIQDILDTEYQWESNCSFF